MKNDPVNSAIELLNEYKEFNTANPKADMVLFAEWLKQKHSNPTDYLTENLNVNDSGTNVMVSYLFTELTAYVEMWVKTSYKDVPISSVGDYAILKSVEHHQKPSKKVVVDSVVMEPTTCIESIKRLVKNGLLAEEIDLADKRMRRVSMTPKGKSILAVIDVKMLNLSNLLMGDLEEPEKLSLIPILKKLSGYHQNIYRSFEKPEIKRIYKI